MTSIADILYRRKNNVHKNDFGHVLVIAGSARMLGAAALSSLAAMRSGAGLVTVVVPKSLNRSLQAKLSSVVMTWPLPETSEQTLSFSAFQHIAAQWHKYQAVVLGPGLSQNPQTKKLILKVIQTCRLPLVIDADALRVVAEHLELLRVRPAPTVLTPHPGEMAVLMGLRTEQIQASRLNVSREFVRNYPCTLVLKGHRSIVAQFKKPLFVNSSGNSGMATAGSGDVLSGMIAAFLAQGLSSFEAAKYGVYFHGQAGDLAARKKSKIAMIAADIIEQIPEVFIKKFLFKK